MEQHPLGVADRRQVVLLALPVALCAVVAGRARTPPGRRGELVQAPAGLDQQPRRHLGAGGEPDRSVNPRSGPPRVNRSRSAASGLTRLSPERLDSLRSSR